MMAEPRLPIPLGQVGLDEPHRGEGQRWSEPLARLGLALFAAIAALALRLPELDRYATIDESRWVGRSADFASYIQSRDFDKTFIVGHPGVTTMWLGALGLGPERVRAFSYLEGQTDVTRREGYLEALAAARRPPVVANAVALGLLVWLAWGLFGPGAAALGGLLIVLDPFFGGHARLLHLDALLGSFMAVVALASVAFWGRPPERSSKLSVRAWPAEIAPPPAADVPPSDDPARTSRSRGAQAAADGSQSGHWGFLLLAGLFSGLAFLTKAPAVYLLAFVPALALFESARAGRWRLPTIWVRLAASLGIWLGVAWLVCLALWPALRLKPLAVLRQAGDFAARNAGSERDNFFWGQPVEDPGLLFYPVALLFRGAPLMLLGLAVLVIVLFRWRRQLPMLWPTLLLGGYAFGFLLFISVGQKKFDRYELPVFPIIDLLAGLGLWYGWRWVVRRFSATGIARQHNGAAPPPRDPAPPRLFVPASPRLLAAGALLLALAAWPLAAVYPYYLAYYNPLVGGGPTAQRLIFVGWGEGLDRVAAYLNAKPILIEAPTVATAYHRVLQAHLNSLGALPLERADLADYIVTYVNSTQRDQKSELLEVYATGLKPEHVVWLNGIEYARVFVGPHLPVERRIDAQFGGGLRLESIVLAPGSGRLRAGDELSTRLRWRPGGEVGALLELLQVVDSRYQPVLEDRQPLGRLLREGVLLVADARLRLPSTLPAGEYRLIVSIEDPPSARVLALQDGSTSYGLQALVIQPAVPR